MLHNHPTYCPLSTISKLMNLHLHYPQWLNLWTYTWILPFPQCTTGYNKDYSTTTRGKSHHLLKLDTQIIWCSIQRCPNSKRKPRTFSMDRRQTSPFFFYIQHSISTTFIGKNITLQDDIHYIQVPPMLLTLGASPHIVISKVRDDLTPRHTPAPNTRTQIHLTSVQILTPKHNFSEYSATIPYTLHYAQLLIPLTNKSES